MLRSRKRLSFANVVSLIALFVALGSGAYAVTVSKNSVKSKHIVNGQVKAADIGGNAVSSPKVKDGSLLAADFAAGQLPAGPKGDQGNPGPQGTPGSADIIGRSNNGASCTLDASAPGEANEGLTVCASTAVDVPRSSRLLVSVAGSWYGFGGNPATGDCRIFVDGAAQGPLKLMGELTNSTESSATQSFSLTAVTGAVAAGNHTAEVRCQEISNDMDWGDVTVAVVALGAG